MDYVPERLHSLLPRYFRDFLEELRRTLTAMRSSPDYAPSTSYSSARADVKAKAEFILNQIARIKSHSKVVGEPVYAAQVAEFVVMLRKFVD